MFAGTAVIALIAYAVLYGRVDGKAPIQSDGYSYYVYLAIVGVITGQPTIW